MKENKLITSKYNIYNFLPVNLYYQLSKKINFFFLSTLILLFIPSISPFSPYTYMMAFLCVLSVSVIKDGYEDYKRHCNDKAFNQRLVYILKVNTDGKELNIEKKFVEDLVIGDTVIISLNEEVPADMIFLNAKNKNKKKEYICTKYCYIETSNLDGEYNYKRKISSFLVNQGECKPNSMKCEFYVCSCDIKSIASIKNFKVFDTGESLYDFECCLETTDQNKVILNEKNVLLRGSKIKNTDQILGIIVSIGKKTKQNLIYKISIKKISIFENQVSKKLSCIFIVYFIILIISSLMGSVFTANNNLQYLHILGNFGKEMISKIFTKFIIYSYLIPISLFVNIEISRFIQGSFINCDKKLTLDRLNSKCRNTNIIENLGAVEFILSDKTGTITRNEMVLKYIHTNSEDRIFDCRFFNKISSTAFDSIKSFQNNIKNFRDNFFETKDFKTIMLLINLLCCNSVELVNNKYQGNSQDEVCIMQELLKYNLRLKERLNNKICLEINGNFFNLEIPMTLEFSSYRQRMDIVIKVFNKYFLLSKGSDHKLLKDSKYNHIKNIINKNSSFRSLVFFGKEINSDIYENMLDDYKTAIYENRCEMLDKIFEKIENDLVYLGTTFIEDQLQNNAEKTIKSLMSAGINFWMITGDKKETAISCAINCGLLEKDFTKNNDRVISANRFIKDENYTEDLIKYPSVIVFRASPDEKYKIVEKFMKLGKATLSIGDGNNDVLMIRKAHVGIGIQGKEGSQACLASDISIPEFQCLSNLILVHGRNSFINISKVTMNVFYRNAFLIFMQFYYDFFNGFTGKPLYNYYFLNYFNTVFTSFVPVTICVFDKDYSDEYLLENPLDYKEVRSHFTSKKFLAKILYSALQASMIFWLIYGIVFKKDLVSSNGYIGGYRALNNLCSLIVFFIVTFRQLLSISFYVKYSFLAILITIILYAVAVFGVLENRYYQRMGTLNLHVMPVFVISTFYIISTAFFIDYLYELFVMNKL